MTFKHALAVNTQMLIRKPVEDVFDAFVNPAITTRFWFTKSTARLKAGEEVRWEWEMNGLSVTVRVKAIDANHQGALTRKWMCWHIRAQDSAPESRSESYIVRPPPVNKRW